MLENWNVVERFCANCCFKLYGSRNEKGLLKLNCPKCNASLIYKKVGRRHERIDVYAPTIKE